MKEAAGQLIAWLKESLQPQDRRGDEPKKPIYPIRIVISGGYNQTKVFIGDFMVPHLVDVSVNHEAGKLPVLTLKIAAHHDTEIIGLSTVLAECQVDDMIGILTRRKADEQSEIPTPAKPTPPPLRDLKEGWL